MAESIKQVLDKTLKDMGLEKKIKEKKVLDLWSEIAGDRINKHTQAKYINRGVLFITVNNSAWAQELMFMKENLIDKLNKRLEDNFVKELKFKVGNLNFNSEVTKHQESVADTIKLAAKEKEEIRNNISGVLDDELQDKIYQVISLDKKNKKLKLKKGWKNCKFCSSLIPPEDEKCLICELKSEKIDYKEIRDFLYTNPWLSYKQLQEIYPELVEQDFKKIKNRLSNRLQQEIDNLSPEVMKKKINPKRLKIVIHNYVMLETEIPPDKLNQRLIKKIIGEQYMKIYSNL